MTTAEKIKELRESLGLSIADLASRAGITVQTIYRYENGEISKITMGNVSKLAKALRCDPATLMGWSRTLPSTTVPVYQKLTEGLSSMAKDNVVDYVVVPEHLAKDGDVFGIRIETDAMSPFCVKGDVAIVRGSLTDVADGDVVIVETAETALLRRVKYGMGHITLCGINGEGDKETVAWDKMDEVHILGKCIELRRPM
ncbi:MAG: XRE family transcriptional regulator [Clostridia bacterium]|nr:XRE family transcriptional regulator [Clostridia bacterium]